MGSDTPDTEKLHINVYDIRKITQNQTAILILIVLVFYPIIHLSELKTKEYKMKRKKLAAATLCLAASMVSAGAQNTTRDKEQADSIITKQKTEFQEFKSARDSAFATYKKLNDKAFKEFKSEIDTVFAKYKNSSDAALQEIILQSDSAIAKQVKSSDAKIKQIQQRSAKALDEFKQR